MREVDRIMMMDKGITLAEMMEDTGRILANIALKLKPNKITVLVGKGNNGGGGLVAARYLAKLGKDVEVILANKDLKEVPKQQLKRLEGLAPIVDKISGDLVIDALLGYGANGKPTKRIIELIQEARGKQVLSLDIPTGIDLNTGEFYENSFKNAIVATIAMPKVNVSYDFIINIGVPKDVYEQFGENIHFGSKDYVKS